MKLYLALNLGSILIPFLFSFHPKIVFYKKWSAFLPAMLVSALIYLIWDVLFTDWGVWGFNSRYLMDLDTPYLPLEEWLFFICIPYACVFTHYTLTKLIPGLRLSNLVASAIGWTLLFGCLLLAIFYLDRAYTAVNSLVTALILFVTLLYRKTILEHYLITYLVILLPFFLVNGALTGSWIEEEVVWYNNAENLGIRIGTIPIEDLLYAFGLLLLNLFFTELFDRRSKKTANLN
jgi:lycopene cyclase domain-containing protein